MKGTGIIKPDEEFLGEKTCDGCYQNVVVKRMCIPMGPRKGEWIVAKEGCKCGDIKLANEALETRERLRNERVTEFFNEQSLINDSLAKATLDNYEPTNDELHQAKQQAIDYIESFDGKKNLLLHGTYGTGKSHLSISITKELLARGRTCLFLSLPKMLTKIRETYNSDGDMTEEKLLNAIKQVDLLVLDDLGAEQKTEWSTPKVFEVMDSREGKSTIYTTNLSSNELKSHYGGRNFSRLMENTEILIMNGKDYRRRAF